MKLIFEKSVSGRGCTLLPPCDVDSVSLPDALRRDTPPALPEVSETELSRHYTELCHKVHGVNCGFYPLGSCTMLVLCHVNSNANHCKTSSGENVMLSPQDTLLL